MPIKTTAIFDIGKTNKKLFLFDEEGQIIYEKAEVLPETTDEDGFACEDIEALENWIKNSLRNAINDKRFIIEKLNFSTYGASLVHLDKAGKRIAPLYNYLKPIPASIGEYLYQRYNGKSVFSATTASPPMDMLNSGLQLLWLKKDKPFLFDQIAFSLHLPQYLSYLFSGKRCNELTSIGCHTALWDFTESDFHDWIQDENIEQLFPPIAPYTKKTNIAFAGHTLQCGMGLHDSSSALVPYLKKQSEPFMLLSTGTWNIALNPFNKEPLTVEELNNDCLSYLSYRGDSVKAARLFFGNEHDYQVKRLTNKFNKSLDYYKSVEFNSQITVSDSLNYVPATMETVKGFLPNSKPWNIEPYKNFEDAYHHLIYALVLYQIRALHLARGNTSIATLYVDGGFAKNNVFINMLNKSLSKYKINIIVADTPNASALGAFLLINNTL